MACTATLSLAPGSGDNPLDAAVYEPVSGYVFGVSNQWIYKYNSATGALVDSKRFTTDAQGQSCILALNGKLYVGVSYSPITDYVAQIGIPPSPSRDIYIIDPVGFTVLSQYGFGPGVLLQQSLMSCGYRCIASDGTNLVTFTTHNNGIRETAGLSTWDPTNLAGTFERVSVAWVEDICYDPTNNVYWYCNSSDPDIWAIQTKSTIFGNACTDVGGVTTPHGVTYNVARNKVYAVQGNATLVKANATDAFPGFNNFPVTTFNTGRANANPFRVKSCNNLPGNPFNGKVLIPAWADDTVLVWNPATDSVLDMVVKTGFSSPIDIVHCPTTSFAVQQSSTGLLLISP